MDNNDPGASKTAQHIVARLFDHVPEARREIRAFAIAIGKGVPEALAGTQRHLAGVEMDRPSTGSKMAPLPAR